VLISRSAEARQILAEQSQRRADPRQDNGPASPPPPRFLCLEVNTTFLERQASYLQRESMIGVRA
jgi:hypothetical protein